jgi:hypothetical protein
MKTINLEAKGFELHEGAVKLTDWGFQQSRNTMRMIKAYTAMRFADRNHEGERQGHHHFMYNVPGMLETYIKSFANSYGACYINKNITQGYYLIPLDENFEKWYKFSLFDFRENEIVLLEHEVPFRDKTKEE